LKFNLFSRLSPWRPAIYSQFYINRDKKKKLVHDERVVNCLAAKGKRNIKKRAFFKSENLKLMKHLKRKQQLAAWLAQR